MELKEFTSYANSFQAIARLELESITLLMKYLGHPEKDINFVHVAGTNGKGSVCAYLQEIFKAQGLKCGKYTSPNLVSVCERISINGEEISESDLNKTLQYVKNASDKAAEVLGEQPTQFEIWTAAAICYFKEKHCDIVVLETGLGGVRDATNVIPPPKASVIVGIDYDHMEYLGDTLSEIAMQKAGIIKCPEAGKRGLTVTAHQTKEAMEALEKAAADKNNKLVKVQNPLVHSPKSVYEEFDYKNLKNLRISMLGVHQVENACIAIETAQYLGAEEQAIREGLLKAKNVGRFEILKNAPLMIFDGAHNPGGMKSLISGLLRHFPDKKPVFVMGVMADKDVSGVLGEIKKAYEGAEILTVAVRDNPRSMMAEDLAERAVNLGFKAKAYESIKDACQIAENMSGMTVICGSLYLYKDYVQICG